MTFADPSRVPWQESDCRGGPDPIESGGVPGCCTCCVLGRHQRHGIPGTCPQMPDLSTLMHNPGPRKKKKPASLAFFSSHPTQNLLFCHAACKQGKPRARVYYSQTKRLTTYSRTTRSYVACRRYTVVSGFNLQVLCMRSGWVRTHSCMVMSLDCLCPARKTGLQNWATVQYSPLSGSLLSFLVFFSFRRVVFWWPSSSTTCSWRPLTGCCWRDACSTSKSSRFSVSLTESGCSTSLLGVSSAQYRAELLPSLP